MTPLTKSYDSLSCPQRIIDLHNEPLDDLAVSENWQENIEKGHEALRKAEEQNRLEDITRICARLASIILFQGDPQDSTPYMYHCMILAKFLQDPMLLIQAYCLRSLVYRILASKKTEQERQQRFYLKAAASAQKAILVYSENQLKDYNLRGKICYHLGACIADNPQGNLKEAVYSFEIAMHCFEMAQVIDSLILTDIRLAQICLKVGTYAPLQETIDTLRKFAATDALAMHIDELEACVRLAQKDYTAANIIAINGLMRAQRLKATEQESRFFTLINKI